MEKNFTSEFHNGLNNDKKYEGITFHREDGPAYVEHLVNDFDTSFNRNNYREIPSVPISSKIDSSVRFIGSHISVLKEFLIDKNIPEEGVYMHQECIRTQNLKSAFEDSHIPKWGSHFTSLGALVKPEKINTLFESGINFIKDDLQIEGKRIKVKVSSEDTDLKAVCRNFLDDDQIEVDSEPQLYYRHNIGIPEINGRNFNFAISNVDSNECKDIGNLILLEEKGLPIGVELALGTTTMLKEVMRVGHVNDFYPVIGLPVMPDGILRKLEDSIIVSTALYREDLRPGAGSNQERLLRTYTKLLSYFRNKSNVSLDILSSVLEKYESTQYKDSISVGKEIIDFLEKYEYYLKSNMPVSKEDYIIKSNLAK